MRAIILLLAAALCCGSVHAQVPRKINYQGYLTNAGGTPVNATVSMTVRLYSAPTGGVALYSEQFTATVTNGVFNVPIGSVTPLALPFDVPYYLGIKVDADPEMTPREELVASPYAIRAASAEALAITATVPGSQISGALSSATLPAASLTGTITGSQLASGLALGGTTAGTFSGPLTGNVTGNVTGNLTGNVTGNVSGSAASFTGVLAGDVTGTQGATVVGAVGAVSAANVAAGANLANAATSANTASTIVKRDASGNFIAGTITGNVTGNVTGNATNFTGALAGNVTGTQGATTIAASTVTGKSLTGFTSGAGTVSASDTILTAINKLDGNVALKAPLASPTFFGNVGVGTTSATSKLVVAGVIESISGGVKFPDGTTQTTAAPVTGAAQFVRTIQSPNNSVPPGVAFTIDTQVFNSIPAAIIPSPGNGGTVFTLNTPGTYMLDYEMSLGSAGSVGIYTGPTPATLALDNNTIAGAATATTWIHGKALVVVVGPPVFVAVSSVVGTASVVSAGTAAGIYMVRLTVLKIS